MTNAYAAMHAPTHAADILPNLIPVIPQCQKKTYAESTTPAIVPAIA